MAKSNVSDGYVMNIKGALERGQDWVILLVDDGKGLNGIIQLYKPEWGSAVDLEAQTVAVPPAYLPRFNEPRKEKNDKGDYVPVFFLMAKVLTLGKVSPKM